LSIDIVLGSLAVGLMAVKIMNVQMGTAWWFVLSLAVWVIYTADHLIDSNKLGNSGSSERRVFYYKHFKLILIIEIIFVIIVAFVCILYLDKEIIYFGICLGLFVAVYLLLVQIKGSEKLWWLQKELIVAVVYTVGIWGGPALLSSQKTVLQEIMLIVTFFLIVWADILIIAQFEIENDKRDKFTSLPVIIGREKNVCLVSAILFVSVFLLFLLLFFQNIDLKIIYADFILLIMSVVLFFLLKFEGFFKRNERYRILAETVFLLPALMVFV